MNVQKKMRGQAAALPAAVMRHAHSFRHSIGSSQACIAAAAAALLVGGASIGTATPVAATPVVASTVTTVTCDNGSLQTAGVTIHVSGTCNGNYVVAAARGASMAAATPVVAPTATTVDCSTGGTLQQAINSASPGDTLHVSGTCYGNFTVSNNLTIIGPATLDGQGSGVVFSVGIGANVTLEDLIVQNGCACSTVGGTNLGGGGIDNVGTLTLENSTVQDNTALGGGGILNLVGTLTLENSSVLNNTGGLVFIGLGGGGGIENLAGAVILDNSSVLNNTELGQGGGIYTVCGTPIGGGACDIGGTVTLKNSLVKGNTASQGGGIYVSGPLPTLENSAVKDNIPDDIFPTP
jgi:hypothetical protein